MSLPIVLEGDSNTQVVNETLTNIESNNRIETVTTPVNDAPIDKQKLTPRKEPQANIGEAKTSNKKEK